MQFRTIMNRQRIPSVVGDRFVPTYSLKIQDDGTKDLVQTGTVDLYGKIQTYKDSCDIHVILERFVNGDVSALSANTPSFGDFTEYPTTYAEMLQRQYAAEEMFMSLPVEVRAEFNHSANEFFTSIGSEKFNAVYDKHFKTDEVVQPGVDVVDPKDPTPIIPPKGDDVVE